MSFLLLLLIDKRFCRIWAFTSKTVVSGLPSTPAASSREHDRPRSSFCTFQLGEEGGRPGQQSCPPRPQVAGGGNLPEASLWCSPYSREVWLCTSDFPKLSWSRCGEDVSELPSVRTCRPASLWAHFSPFEPAPRMSQWNCHQGRWSDSFFLGHSLAVVFKIAIGYCYLSSFLKLEEFQVWENLLVYVQRSFSFLTEVNLLWNA